MHGFKEESFNEEAQYINYLQSLCQDAESV